MSSQTYRFRRVATYYARLDVPTDLQEIVGTSTLKKSLYTKDNELSKRLVGPVIEEWRRWFDDLRARRILTDDDKAHAVWQHYETTIKQDEQKRRSMPSKLEIQAEHDRLSRRIDLGEINSDDFVGMVNAYTEIELMVRARTDDANYRIRRLAALTHDLATGETQRIELVVQKFIADNRLIIEPNGDEFRELCTVLIRAEIEGLKRTVERDEGNYEGRTLDPIVKPANNTRSVIAETGKSVTEVFELYAAENPNQVKTDTINQARRDIGLFVQCVGTTYPVARIDKKNVREWKALLLKFPVKATETKIFQGMTIEQAVRHNEQIGKPVITPRTVNRHLASLGAFCKWLVNHGYLDQNPVSGMSLTKEKRSKTLTFTVDQMNILFSSPLFTGCQNDNQWRYIKKPGNVLIRDHRYWVPLIMLFSGARPGEIAQLSVADVRKEHGHWIMHITEEGDGDKSVKTEGSMRVLPIHDELLKLGFIEYHNRMVASGQDRMFPKAKRNTRGQMIADYSREFPRYLTSLGIKKGRGHSLYSFRHGVTDALRRAGYLDEQFGFILGHTSGSMTGRYGMMPQGMLETRVELINSISYDGLDLDHLILS